MEQKMIDMNDIIGVYSFSNTMSLLIHKIDYVDDRVLVSENGENKQWCDIVEYDDEEDLFGELGFKYGEILIPFNEVLRFNSWRQA